MRGERGRKRMICSLRLVRAFGVLALVSCGALALGGEGKWDGDLWFVSGQSNACGRGKLPGLAADPRVQIYDLKAKKWVPAKDPLPGMGSRGVGPWQAAGVEMAKAGVKVRMTGYARGGKPISHWDEQGRVWQKVMLKRIAAAGKGADAFLWYQGENDGCYRMDAETYQKKLTDLVARMRKATGNPKMLVVVIQLGGWRKRRGSFMPIREAERRFVVADPAALLVPALGRKMRDTVHLNREGQVELGKAIARALLKVRHKRDVNWPGPVLDGAVLRPGGKEAVAHFAEVKRLGGCRAGDFGVVDPDGQVKCVKAEAANTLIELTFERPVKLPAILIYGFGENPRASLVDEAGNRAPAAQIKMGKGGRLADTPTSAPNGAGRK